MPPAHTLYTCAVALAGPALRVLLRLRAARGKEDPARLAERTGRPSLPRPDGPVVWIHAASVGESASALILVERLLAARADLRILVTTGTVTAAALMAARLPAPRALHQYAPLDVPAWAARFLDHWRPDAALWMESELWPATLAALRARAIPAALVNARLSPRSFGRWSRLPRSARTVLSGFCTVLAQTEAEAACFRSLGAQRVEAVGNLKYGAAPLEADLAALELLRAAVGGRPVWLYASTHAGEEALAGRVHAALSARLPGLVTIIVPRHPGRRGEIRAALPDACFRGEGRAPPGPGGQVYVADTLGEMGLFYRLAPVACIGRSFSDDGGGGHNPIEAARLGCFPLHGPRVQNLRAIYAEMGAAGATQEVAGEAALTEALHRFFANPAMLTAAQDRARAFVEAQTGVVDRVMQSIEPLVPCP